MCGRYYIDDETSVEIKKIIQNISKHMSETHMKMGEIYPSQEAPILVAKKDEIVPRVITWGASGYDKGSRIINARSETVFEKRMFQDSIKKRRCIIPANGFYEWNQVGKKKKYYFTDYDADTIYMAGIYNQFQGIESFIILTTSANAGMKEIHNRMPILLQKDEMQEWILDTTKTQYFLKKVPKELNQKLMMETNLEYEQLTMDLL